MDRRTGVQNRVVGRISRGGVVVPMATSRSRIRAECTGVQNRDVGKVFGIFVAMRKRFQV